MKTNLLKRMAWSALCLGISFNGVQAADYCTSGTLTRTEGGRRMNSFTLTDGSTNIDVTVNQSASTGSPSYFDKTASKLTVSPGATLSFSNIDWTGAWMHVYAYIDYDNDGQFDTDLNADGTTDGELVAYSYSGGTNSLGETTANNSGVSAGVMPPFILPASLAPGEYRLRLKVDWDSTDPCGSTIEKDGGCIVDMTLEVEQAQERTITIKSADPAKGSVAFEGHEGMSVTIAGPVTAVATPANGYMFINWINDATEELYSDQASIKIGGNQNLSLTANFGDIAYPSMYRTFTNNSGQQNRYLKKVTTEGTETPEVFSCATQADLPYTAFTSSANTYVESGALIDKTANPIVVAAGTQEFAITYYAWDEAISSNNSELSWTQEAYFVDWNKNGTFTDAGEISEKGNTTMPNSSIATGFSRTVKIPQNQAPGTYRMRVVFFEPASSGEAWQNTLFTTLNRRIRNGIAYDFEIEILPEQNMTITSVTPTHRNGNANPGQKDVIIADINVSASGTLEPINATGIDMSYTGNTAVSNLRWIYSTTDSPSNNVIASASTPEEATHFSFDTQLAHGNNRFFLIADVAEDAVLGSNIKVDLTNITVGDEDYALSTDENNGITIADDIDYTLGNALWFDTPNSSTTGAAIWNYNDFSGTDTNPDQIWERKSFPLGNGSFGGNVLGSVNSERVVLNEKTLWKGGPGAGAATYWNMNKTVNESTLQTIRQYLANGQNSSANSLVASNYRGNIDYSKAFFGTYTTMGEARVSTGINESAVTNYKRIVNMDRSLVVVQFDADGTFYQRRYFASYPDSVMVWRYTSEGAPQNLTFSLTCPQIINSVTSPEEGTLLYDGKLDNNNMQWALKVLVRTNDGGKVTANATARTITVSGSNDVEFILAGDTDYAMNFDPDINDPAAFVGVDPVASVNGMVNAAALKTYDELYAAHYADYSELFDRVKIEINPNEKYANQPTPTRLSKYRSGTTDHELEQQYFQYGRYLLISSSRAGNMPANLQGMWHNNIDGPWRVDYHNNINLQMNYWPATCTNLLECFTPFIDYVRGLVKPGERTAQAYYGARGWTAEVSTNIFGFTAPLNSTDMSWNYNPTAGPWLATQIWEYYDYTRDKEWLREIGYPIIKSSADFVSDLLYLHNGTYTSSPSYSPEHGTADLGATYANAVTREVLDEAIKASEILGEDADKAAEWKEKLDKMYPYQVGRYGQLQEWYNDIDTYNDTHRHTNHLFGLHPGSSINALEDTELVDACKETLKQRGDAATGWSMGWKLNHWARLLDGDHAYILFQNLIKNGTADNMWDLHPPFQIDGNFGGTAGISELFLQSHNGLLHLLPALPSKWTNGRITGLRTRGNFVVDVTYNNGKLDNAIITSNAGEPCKVYYDGKMKEFETVTDGKYLVTYDAAKDILTVNDMSSLESIEIADTDNVSVSPNPNNGHFTVKINGAARGELTVEVYTLSGQRVKSINVDKQSQSIDISMSVNAPSGLYFLHIGGKEINITEKFIVK
jgi:glycoside hydrolase family 95